MLCIGISDDGKAVGIEDDFKLLGAGMQNQDGWELMLRDLIKTRFHERGAVNDYVYPVFVTDDKTISRLEITPRKKLSLLKYGSRCTLYKRQGNRTVEVPLEEIEEFFQLRRNF